MSFIQDFKAFALKGNVVDMAVGVIIGGAFGKIVTSIVNNIIMPPIGVLTAWVKEYPSYSAYWPPTLSNKPRTEAVERWETKERKQP